MDPSAGLGLRCSAPSQTDRQTAPWTRVEPQTAAAAAETTEAGRTEKGERGLPGPRGLPAATPAQDLGDPGRNGGQWLRVLQNTVGTQSRGSARAPRGARGARLCESPLRDPSAGAGFAAAALGAAAGARDAGSAPPSLSREDRCARHADDIPKTAARSQATPRAGLCSPWSGHAPRTPTVCPSVGTQSGTAPHSREALMTPESRVWQLPLSLPTWGRGTRMEELCAL